MVSNAQATVAALQGNWWDTPVFWAIVVGVGLFVGFCIWSSLRRAATEQNEGDPESVRKLFRWNGPYSEDDDQPIRRINPATGLPMHGMFDISGNLYGFDDD
jgi:hypothetical protein